MGFDFFLLRGEDVNEVSPEQPRSLNDSAQSSKTKGQMCNGITINKGSIPACIIQVVGKFNSNKNSLFFISFS